MDSATRAIGPLRQRMIEDVRMRKFSAKTRSAYIRAVRLFFEFTVGDPERMAKMTPVPVPHKLPVMLSREEVARLIATAGSLKYL